MNEVFFIGKITTDVKFEFLINSKNISIAIFKVKLENKSEVLIKCYNEIADFCYRYLEKNKYIFINGNLNSNIEIIIKKLNLL